MRSSPFRATAPLVLLLISGPADAQSVADGSDARIAPDTARTLLAQVRQDLRSEDAKVTRLREGRGGAICGAVEIRNRMGTYTGARPFVFDPATRFLGRLPEAPELRNPGSPAAFMAMERARTLYLQNCTED